MRKIEIIFKQMLPIITEALDDHIDNKGNIPKIGRNPSCKGDKHNSPVSLWLLLWQFDILGCYRQRLVWKNMI